MERNKANPPLDRDSANILLWGGLLNDDDSVSITTTLTTTDTPSKSSGKSTLSTTAPSPAPTIITDTDAQDHAKAARATNAASTMSTGTPNSIGNRAAVTGIAAPLTIVSPTDDVKPTTLRTLTPTLTSATTPFATSVAVETAATTFSTIPMITPPPAIASTPTPIPGTATTTSATTSDFSLTKHSPSAAITTTFTATMASATSMMPPTTAPNLTLLTPATAATTTARPATSLATSSIVTPNTNAVTPSSKVATPQTTPPATPPSTTLPLAAVLSATSSSSTTTTSTTATVGVLSPVPPSHRLRRGTMNSRENSSSRSRSRSRSKSKITEGDEGTRGRLVHDSQDRLGLLPAKGKQAKVQKHKRRGSSASKRRGSRHSLSSNRSRSGSRNSWSTHGRQRRSRRSSGRKVKKLSRQSTGSSRPSLVALLDLLPGPDLGLLADVTDAGWGLRESPQSAGSHSVGVTPRRSFDDCELLRMDAGSRSGPEAPFAYPSCGGFVEPVDYQASPASRFIDAEPAQPRTGGLQNTGPMKNRPTSRPSPLKGKRPLLRLASSDPLLRPFSSRAATPSSSPDFCPSILSPHSLSNSPVSQTLFRSPQVHVSHSPISPCPSLPTPASTISAPCSLAGPQSYGDQSSCAPTLPSKITAGAQSPACSHTRRCEADEHEDGVQASVEQDPTLVEAEGQMHEQEGGKRKQGTSEEHLNSLRAAALHLQNADVISLQEYALLKQQLASEDPLTIKLACARLGPLIGRSGDRMPRPLPRRPPSAGASVKDKQAKAICIEGEIKITARHKRGAQSHKRVVVLNRFVVTWHRTTKGRSRQETAIGALHLNQVLSVAGSARRRQLTLQLVAGGTRGAQYQWRALGNAGEKVLEAFLHNLRLYRSLFGKHLTVGMLEFLVTTRSHIPKTSVVLFDSHSQSFLGLAKRSDEAFLLRCQPREPDDEHKHVLIAYVFESLSKGSNKTPQSKKGKMEWDLPMTPNPGGVVRALSARGKSVYKTLLECSTHLCTLDLSAAKEWDLRALTGLVAWQIIAVPSLLKTTHLQEALLPGSLQKSSDLHPLSWFVFTSVNALNSPGELEASLHLTGHPFGAMIERHLNVLMACVPAKQPGVSVAASLLRGLVKYIGTLFDQLAALKFSRGHGNAYRVAQALERFCFALLFDAIVELYEEELAGKREELKKRWTKVKRTSSLEGLSVPAAFRVDYKPAILFLGTADAYQSPSELLRFLSLYVTELERCGSVNRPMAGDELVPVSLYVSSQAPWAFVKHLPAFLQLLQDFRAFVLSDQHLFSVYDNFLSGGKHAYSYVTVVSAFSFLFDSDDFRLCDSEL